MKKLFIKIKNFLHRNCAQQNNIDESFTEKHKAELAALEKERQAHLSTFTESDKAEYSFMKKYKWLTFIFATVFFFPPFFGIPLSITFLNTALVCTAWFVSIKIKFPEYRRAASFPFAIALFSIMFLFIFFFTGNLVPIHDIWNGVSCNCHLQRGSIWMS